MAPGDSAVHCDEFFSLMGLHLFVERSINSDYFFDVVGLLSLLSRILMKFVSCIF